MKKRKHDWSKWKWIGDQVLRVKKFKRSIREYSYEEKIRELKKFTTYRIGNHASYAKRRSKKFYPSGDCEVCLVKKADVQHHMIMVFRGGTNKKYNRINICNECHETIHTWMGIGREIKRMDSEFSNIIAGVISGSIQPRI